MEDLEELLENSIGSLATQEEVLTLARQDPDQFKPEVIQLLNYVRYVRENKRSERYPIATSITISTVSSIGMISESRVLDLKLLSESLVEDIGEEGYFIDSIGLKRRKKPGKGKSEFGNSMNIKLRGCRDRKLVNVILSQNGRMTLTGSDDLEYGYICMKRLVEEIKFFPQTFYNVNPETLAVENHQITMINTDYSLGFEIDQVLLYEILIGEYPYLVTFNPEIYPGISIHYMLREGQVGGVCNCMPSCLSRKRNGHGKGENDCREITCAIFETGKVIISGSNTIAQVNDIYDKVNQLLKNHYEEIACFTIKGFPSDRIIEVN